MFAGSLARSLAIDFVGPILPGSRPVVARKATTNVQSGTTPTPGIASASNTAKRSIGRPSANQIRTPVTRSMPMTRGSAMTVADKKKLKPSETSAITIASPIRTQEGDFQIFDGAESGIANKIDEFYLFSYSVQTKNIRNVAIIAHVDYGKTAIDMNSLFQRRGQLRRAAMSEIYG